MIHLKCSGDFTQPNAYIIFKKRKSSPKKKLQNVHTSAEIFHSYEKIRYICGDVYKNDNVIKMKTTFAILKCLIEKSTDFISMNKRKHLSMKKKKKKKKKKISKNKISVRRSKVYFFTRNIFTFRNLSEDQINVSV